MGNALSLPHILIIAVVVLALFGRGKVSALMGEVGKGITAFKKGVNSEVETPAAEVKPLAATTEAEVVEKKTV